MLMYGIIITSILFLFSIVFWFMEPIVFKRQLENFIEIKQLFFNEVDYTIARYVATKGVHDLLVGDVAVSINEYNSIIMEGCTFVLNNITKKFKGFLLSNFTTEEIQEIVIGLVTSKVDETYTISFMEPIEEFDLGKNGE